MLFLVFLCCSLSLLFREFVFLKKLNWSEKYLRFVVRGQTHNNGRRGVCSQWPSTLYAHKILRQHCYILPISRRNKSKTRNREAISAGVSIPAEIILRWGNKLCFLFMFIQLVFCCGFVLKDNIYIYIYQVSVICRFNSLVRQMFVQEQQGVLTRLQFWFLVYFMRNCRDDISFEKFKRDLEKNLLVHQSGH